MFANYKEAWDELKNRQEDFLWALEHRGADEQRIKDTKGLIAKMEYFEEQIFDIESVNLTEKKMKK